VAMVHELADFERAPEQCHLVEEQLHEALFRPEPALFGHVALDDGEHIGMALWFLNFSTWRGRHGIYLEDLYVRPAARGTGAGFGLCRSRPGKWPRRQRPRALLGQHYRAFPRVWPPFSCPQSLAMHLP